MYIMAQVQSRATQLCCTGKTRHETAVEMLRGYIQRIEIPVQREYRVIDPEIIMPVDPEELTPYQDENLLIDRIPLADNGIPYVANCRVCAKYHIWIPNIREGCTPQCRFEVATHRFGSLHWSYVESTWTRAGRRVTWWEKLPAWQRELTAAMTHRGNNNRPGGYSYIYESRLVYALHLGRELFSHERVHFKNNNPLDVRLANLRLVQRRHPLWREDT